MRPLEALFNDYFWHEFFHMYVAGFIVAAFLVAGVYAYAWLKGRRDHYHRAALIVPLTVACIAAPVQLLMGDWAGAHGGRGPADEAGRLRGPRPRPTEGAVHTSAASTTTARTTAGSTIPDMLSLLADHDPSATVQGLDSVPEPTTGRRSRVVRNAFSVDGLHRHRRSRCWRALYLLTWWRRRRACRARSGSTGRSSIAGPAAVVALIAGLDHDRGRPPAVDRLRDDEDDGGGHRRRAGSRSATRPWRSSISAWSRSSSGCCADSPASRSSASSRVEAEVRPLMAVDLTAAVLVARPDRVRGSRRGGLRRRLLGPDRRRRRARRPRPRACSSAR